MVVFHDIYGIPGPKKLWRKLNDGKKYEFISKKSKWGGIGIMIKE